MVPASRFYHLEGREIGAASCQGLACFVARDRDPERWDAAAASELRVACLGRCYEAPAAAWEPTTVPVIEAHAHDAVVLGRAVAGATTLSAARAAGAYAALEQVVASDPSTIVEQVVRSGLRGRGGAAFPTGRKWEAVAAASVGSDRTYVVANADEGDAGAYIDRLLIERDPHGLIEGLAIAAVVVGATDGVVYLRKEYPDARTVLEDAIAEARSAGILGRDLAGTGRPFDISVTVGEGSYVCGEETALLNSIEGRRPVVRARPPFPAQRGLWGRPTLVNNVETLVSVPWIVTHGGARYADMGTSGSPGTKVVSLNSLFARPGLYEVEFGISVREIVEGLGGGLRDGGLRGVHIGGPLAGVLPPRLLDTRFTVEDLRAVGCDVGHGGIIAFDHRTSIPELIHQVFRFGAFESCGECTPCRVGAGRIEAAFAAGAPSEDPTRARFAEIVELLAETSLCGHGTGLAAFARSLIEHYPDEVAPWLA